MENQITKNDKPGMSQTLLETALISGDLSKLTPSERLLYYSRICESIGLNPLTRPLEYINLNGRLTLYARKDCTEQLRKIHKISVRSLASEIIEGVYIVTANVQDSQGRMDVAKGAVAIKGLAGDSLANAVMKAETKAKRRATLSICGLGMLDESEIETLPASAYQENDSSTPNYARLQWSDANATTFTPTNFETINATGQPKRLSESDKNEEAPAKEKTRVNPVPVSAAPIIDFSGALIKSFVKNGVFQHATLGVGDKIFKIYNKGTLEAAVAARDSKSTAKAVYRVEGLDLILTAVESALI